MFVVVCLVVPVGILAVLQIQTPPHPPQTLQDPLVAGVPTLAPAVATVLMHLNLADLWTCVGGSTVVKVGQDQHQPPTLVLHHLAPTSMVGLTPAILPVGVVFTF